MNIQNYGRNFCNGKKILLFLLGWKQRYMIWIEDLQMKNNKGSTEDES